MVLPMAGCNSDGRVDALPALHHRTCTPLPRTYHTTPTYPGPTPTCPFTFACTFTYFTAYLVTFTHTCDGQWFFFFLVYLR